MKSKTKTSTKKLQVECLACEDTIYVGSNFKIGGYLICNNCDAEFQIIDLKPIIMIDWPDEDDYVDEEEGYYDDINDEYDI